MAPVAGAGTGSDTSRKGTAPNPAPPIAAKVRVRFAKRGRVRFASHRDVARAFEWGLRRAELPVAYSHGFSPHPRLSWVGAAPTGTASEAEYVELGLTEPVSPEQLVAKLDAALPKDLDVLAAVATKPDDPPLADLIDASEWRIELPGVAPATLASAVAALLASDSVVLRRTTKNGTRPVDVRGAVISATVDNQVDDLRTGVAGLSSDANETPCAIMSTVVRQTTPAVRPDDVLGALQVVADLRPPVPPKATRLAQGLLDDQGRLVDPFVAARATTSGVPRGSGVHHAPAAGD